MPVTKNEFSVLKTRIKKADQPIKRVRLAEQFNKDIQKVVKYIKDNISEYFMEDEMPVKIYSAPLLFEDKDREKVLSRGSFLIHEDLVFEFKDYTVRIGFASFGGFKDIMENYINELDGSIEVADKYIERKKRGYSWN